MNDKTASAIIDLRQFITEKASPDHSINAMSEQEFYLSCLEELKRQVEASATTRYGTEAQINMAYHRAESARTALFNHGLVLEDLERHARFELGEEWYKARSGDIRKAMIEEFYKDSEAYALAKNDHDQARHEFRLAMLNVERVRTLVEFAKRSISDAI